MPSRRSDAADLASLLIDKVDVGNRGLSGKSRPPNLEHPSLLQLRSRYVFGVGARADIVSNLVMRSRLAGAQRLSASKRLLKQIDHWAIALLEDNVWDASWTFGAEDISSEILDVLHDDVVAAVQSGDYRLDIPSWRS